DALEHYAEIALKIGVTRVLGHEGTENADAFIEVLEGAGKIALVLEHATHAPEARAEIALKTCGSRGRGDGTLHYVEAYFGALACGGKAALILKFIAD